MFDTQSGADEENVNPTQFSGGSRVILYGLLSMRQMALLSLAFYAVGIGIGVFLAAESGWGLLWIGVAGALISLFYTAPPLKLVHRGLGEICRGPRLRADHGPRRLLRADRGATTSSRCWPRFPSGS